MIGSVRKFFQQSVVYTLGNILRKSLSFLIVPVVTRFMPASEYGVYALLMALNAWLTEIYHLGLGTAVTRIYFDFRDQELRKRYLGSIWAFVTIFTFVLSLLLTLVGRPVFARVLRDIPFWPHVLLVVWATFFGMFGLLPYVVLRIREETWKFVLIVVGNALGSGGLSILFVVVFRLQALGMVLAVFVTTIVFMGIFGFLLRGMISLKLRGYPVLQWLRSSLVYGIPIVLLELGWVVLESSDRFLLQHYLSLETVGLYSLGYALSKVINYVTDSVELAWAPFFYRTAAEQSAEAPGIFAYAASYYCGLLIVLGLAVVLFRHQFVAVMAPREYWGAVQVTPVIVLASVFRGLYNIPARGLMQEKRTHYFPGIVFAGAGINVLLNVLFIPRFGMMGAAWATAIAHAVMLVVTFVVSQRTYPIPYELGRIGKLVGAAGIILAAGELLPAPNGMLGLAYRSALFLSFPLLLYWFGFFGRAEREWFREAVGRRVRLVNGRVG